MTEGAAYTVWGCIMRTDRRTAVASGIGYGRRARCMCYYVVLGLAGRASWPSYQLPATNGNGSER